MKRRDFLKITSAVPLPLLLNGLPLNATAASPLLQLLSTQSLGNGKVLVLIQMNGGNDGLNTVIPRDQYSRIANARSNIMIPEDKVLQLKNTSVTGFHPSMTEIQDLFNNDQVNIVQAVSYENPNFSHFRASDIWLTGSAPEVSLTTGWLGRAQDTSFPGYPANYPSSTMPDPLAVQIGVQASVVTQCSTINTALTVNNPASFYQLIEGQVDPAPDNAYGHELTFLRLIKQQTNAYTQVIKNAFDASSNLVIYPDSNPLADQLKIVARLIKGGLKTPIYIVNHTGTFDTHAEQVEQSDTTQGTHATALSALSKAINSFQKDLVAMSIADRVASMTFTEFGRRIKSNESRGTDHGAGVPVFFFGTSVNPTIIGTNPTLPDNATSSDQIEMQHDFRSVYYSVLKDWFEMSDEQLNSVLFQPYPVLPIFKQEVALPVNLLSFTGKWLTNNVVLKWEVDHESGIDYYEVQRSDDAVNFDKIGVVSAVNTAVPLSYTFTDSNLSKSLYYYRIKVIEKSGAIEYSSVILLKTNQSRAGVRFKVFPNPVSDFFSISFEEKISGTVTAKITDLTGKEIWKDEKEAASALNLRFSLSGKKPAAGIYMLKIFAKKDEATVKILIQ